MQQNVIARWYFSIDAIFSIDRPGYQIEIVLSVISFTRGKEGAIEIIAIMIDGAATAVSPCKFNASCCQLTNVAFTKRILMTSNDDAGIVQPQHQHVMISKVVVLIDPIFECQVCEDIVGLRDEDWFPNRLTFLSTLSSRFWTWREIALRNAACIRTPEDTEKTFRLLQYVRCHHHLELALCSHSHTKLFFRNEISQLAIRFLAFEKNIGSK